MTGKPLYPAVELFEVVVVGEPLPRHHPPEEGLGRNHMKRRKMSLLDSELINLFFLMFPEQKVDMARQDRRVCLIFKKICPLLQ